jgi:ABC-type multidrug transport system fused ATPase/permease subunit
MTRPRTFATGAAQIFYQNFVIQTLCFDFKGYLLRKYARMDYGFYLTRNSSYNMAVIAGDVENMFSGGVLSLCLILTELVVFIGLCGLLIYMNPALTILLFAFVGGLSAVSVFVLLPAYHRWGLQMQDSRVQLNQNLLQFFHAFKESILFGQQDYFIQSYARHSYKNSRLQALQSSINMVPRIGLEVVFVMLFVAAIVFMSLQMNTPQQMMGALGGYLYAGFRMMPGLNRILWNLNNYKLCIPNIERVYEEYTTVEDPAVTQDNPALTFHHQLEMRDVCFRYLSTSHDALSNINLTIKKGECLGIMGQTGSGKSTLVDVMLGLLKPHTGSIVIDGLYSVQTPSWHKKIGYVPQNIYLVDDTILANIAIGEDAESINQDRLNRAIEEAQLTSLIDKLPEGLQTTVGERGVRLSGGERQRIAIARALYRQPEVLIFDEATSALDQATEARLIEMCNNLRQGRTLIMVAHRLTTLKYCDRVVVLGQGKIQNVLDAETFKEKLEESQSVH